MFLSPIIVLQYWRALRKERTFKDSESSLKLLKEKGFIVGLATNGTDFEVALKIPSIINLFDLRVTSSDVTHKKPNPEMILKGMKKAGVRPEDTLYVGDTLVDFLASKNASTKFALVTTGTFGADMVKIGKEKPQNIFQNLTQLTEFILNS